jgi:DNA replication protein DnaD
LTRHPEWVQEAFDLALSKNKQTPSYITGILRNWIAEGRNQKGQTRANNPSRTSKTNPPTSPTEHTAAQRAAAQRIMARRKTSV